KAVLLEPGNWYYQNTLGVAHYRLGQWTEGAHALEHAVQLSHGQHDAFDLFFLAMCYHRLGHTARAKECLDRADTWWKAQKDLDAYKTAELTAYRKEAAAVLGLSAPGP